MNNVSNLVISDSAVSRLKNIAGDGWLRVSVEGGGCSGFQYKLDLEEGGDMAEDDVLVERDGARVVVDQTSLEYLEVRGESMMTQIINLILSGSYSGLSC